MIQFKHARCYVYEFVLSRREGGYEAIKYELLTDITGPKHKQNREWLEQGIRIAYGFKPKGITYKYDKYK
jgi:hypothetical protein